MSELDRATSGVARRVDHLQIPLTQSTEEDSWLVTYLDVITLLLVMFVVMLALSGGPSELPDESVNLAPSEPAVAPVTVPQSALELSSAESEVFAARARSALQAAGLTDDITVIAQPDGVRFRISNDILFGSGEAVLSAEGMRQLDKLVPLLAAGYADTRPLNRNDTEQGRARNRRVEIILEDGSMMKEQIDQGASRR